MLMKKLFTLLAMIFCVGVVHAQRITFDQYNDEGFPMLLESYSAGDFKLTYVDTAGKFAPDADNKSDKVYSANFGTAESFEKFTGRLKPGSKSSEKNNITLTIPSDGTLKVYARSASSSATDRNLVLTQDGTELFNKVIKDADAVKVYLNPEEPDKATSIYGVVSVEVKAGTVNVTYPTGSINFYGFEFEAAGSSAPTEYTVNITSDPENNYFSGYEAFAPADIASALGLSVEEMIELINAKDAEGKVVGGNVYIQLADGMKSNVYTGNTNEFWMGKDGQPQGYGEEGTCWYVGLSYDGGGTDETTGESSDPEVDVAVGQMPDFFRKVYTDSDLSTTIYLMNGDKSVKFNVNLHVNAAPEPTLPEPKTNLLDLTFVKEYELLLTFKPGGQYEGTTVSTTLDGLYEALGTTAEELDANITDMTFTQVLEGTKTGESEDAETIYNWSNELKTPDSASGGAWFGRYTNWNEEEGKEVAIEMNAPKEWGASCTFYAQNITLKDEVFSILTGQYPGTMKVGDNDYAYLYIIVGDKAAKIKVTATVKAPDAGTPSLSTYQKVGEQTLSQTATKISDYLEITTPITNIEEIASLLGTETSEITKWHTSAEGEYLTDMLDDGRGTWVNAEGVKEAWGAAVFMVAYESLEDGSYAISTLQNEGKGRNNLEVGKTFSFPFYLVSETNGTYYQINFEYTIEESNIDPSTWEKAYAASYDVQLIQAEGYGQNEVSQTHLDWSDIATAIGTSSPVLYTENWEENEETGVESMKYTSVYTCTPHPGFWMSADGRSSTGHAPTCAYGMTLSSSGVITYYVHPDANHQVGDNYTSKFYLVNEETGKYALITLNIEYVEERGAAPEEVGNTTATIEITDPNFDGDYYSSSEGVDWNAVYEALGITEDGIEDCQWMVQNSFGKLVVFQSAFEDENAQFDQNGYLVDTTDPTVDLNTIKFAVGYNYDRKVFTFSDMGNELAEDEVVKTKVALKSEKGYYVFNIVIGSPEAIASGITGISADSMNDGKIYDLSGRRVAVPTKGLYIMNGKKVYVK